MNPWVNCGGIIPSFLFTVVIIGWPCFPEYLLGILDPLRLTPTYRTCTLFQVACQTIEFGRGVCGKAADSGETQLVQVDQIQSTVAVMMLTGTSYSFINAECS